MRDPSLRVLLIDPEDTSAHAVGAALERRNLSVRAARDLDRGLELEPAPRVIVAELAGLDGRDAARLAAERARPEAPALLLLLDQPRAEELRRALLLGAADVLCKPFRIEELAAAIETLARREVERPGPPPPSDALRRSYPAHRESVERAARDLAAFGLRVGVSPTCRARAATACAEIVHNACRHAYPDGAGLVELEADLVGRELVVCVRDWGRGFQDSPPLAGAFDAGFECGLGRAAALAEALDVASTPGQGARVVLRFSALRADFDGEEGLDLTELDYLLPESARAVLEAVRADRGEGLVLSPALAVLVGRLLAGPNPRSALSMALWS